MMCVAAKVSLVGLVSQACTCLSSSCQLWPLLCAQFCALPYSADAPLPHASRAAPTTSSTSAHSVVSLGLQAAQAAVHQPAAPMGLPTQQLLLPFEPMQAPLQPMQHMQQTYYYEQPATTFQPPIPLQPPTAYLSTQPQHRSSQTNSHVPFEQLQPMQQRPWPQPSNTYVPKVG